MLGVMSDDRAPCPYISHHTLLLQCHLHIIHMLGCLCHVAVDCVLFFRGFSRCCAGSSVRGSVKSRTHIEDVWRFRKI